MGPAYFAIMVAGLIGLTLAKWAYFYGTMVITLAVYPTNQR